MLLSLRSQLRRSCCITTTGIHRPRENRRGHCVLFKVGHLPLPEHELAYFKIVWLTFSAPPGINFHIREDALNAEKNQINAAVLKPASRLGGISYGRTTTAYELPRPDFKSEVKKDEYKGFL